MRLIHYILLLLTITLVISSEFTVARIKYSGGGDWYSDKSSLPNLLEYLKMNTNINTSNQEKIVEIGDEEFIKNSYFYLTGHGNITLSDREQFQLREHLYNGAFIHVDDNYGLDKSFRKLIKEIFPDKNLVELPPNHEIFNCFYKFPNGLPKVHEHDNKRPQALGIFNNEKLILLYTYESDLGDGWEDPQVHNNPEYIRNQALKMGVNIIIYALSQ